ncbi:hypothetical protein LXJ56_24645, partial [Escherichia coli]|nr:hypothetical protein [Escherichia coli]
MRVMMAASLAVIAMATAGCQVKVSDAANNTAAATPAAAAPASKGDWAKFRDGFIEGWFRLDPANAVYQGRHDFDGQLPDWSNAGLKRQAAFLHQAI